MWPLLQILRGPGKNPGKSRRLTRQMIRKLPIIWRSSYVYLVTRVITFCLHALSCLGILLCFMSDNTRVLVYYYPSRRNQLYTFVFALHSMVISFFPLSLCLFFNMILLVWASSFILVFEFFDSLLSISAQSWKKNLKISSQTLARMNWILWFRLRLSNTQSCLGVACTTFLRQKIFVAL